MRFLLVFITSIFSFIFYLFYTASLGKNIFLQESDHFFFGTSIFGELWISFAIYIFLSFFLFFYLRSKKYAYKNIIYKNKEENIRPVQEINFQKYIFGVLFFYIIVVIIFILLHINIHGIVFIFAGVFGISFLGKYLFYKKKIEKKVYILGNIFSILSSYLLSILFIISSYFLLNNILFLSIGIFLGLYHIYIHIYYENMISFLFGIITGIFSLYRLIVFLFPGII